MSACIGQGSRDQRLGALRAVSLLLRSFVDIELYDAEGLLILRLKPFGLLKRRGGRNWLAITQLPQHGLAARACRRADES